MTGFEPATTRPPDVYSNRAELHPASEKQCKCRIKKSVFKILSGLFLLSGHFPCFRKPGSARITGKNSAGTAGVSCTARFGPVRNIAGKRPDGPPVAPEAKHRPGQAEPESTVSFRLHMAGYLSGAAISSSIRSEERRVGKECRSRWSPYH